MDLENAMPRQSSRQLFKNEIINSLVDSLTPILGKFVAEAVDLAVADHMSLKMASPTISKKDFAAINGISHSVLEKWIANGVVLLAPTPTATVRRIRKCEITGEKSIVMMEKHGNALINLEAWREKNRQQAIKCRYIKA
ncbi:hypothetical protein SJI19_03035 [Acerihabitans sp. TG2]|uniref:hypothetical protein n=1 Tax=Acerihabitans sp. TG2 TaxID=3096008 RepID=UPI002B224714|nr:hypothetical protein [Acerihabitans sp. TG2]MEA9389535.1 hypothetical protein [Acerihabitans sp. TG2]